METMEKGKLMETMEEMYSLPTLEELLSVMEEENSVLANDRTNHNDYSVYISYSSGPC